jgi:DNA-binding MarR family transcriptional regulator
MTALNGQILGQAERASAAVLERLLATKGTTFTEWVALNQLAIGGGSADHDELVAAMVAGLKTGADDVRETLAGLVGSGLVDAWRNGGTHLALTDAGRRRHAEIRTGIGEISSRLYAGLPADDLEIAGRVLATLTERANAELARS